MLASAAGPEADIYALGGIMDYVSDETSGMQEDGTIHLLDACEMHRLVMACQRLNEAARPKIDEVKRRFHEKIGIKTGGFLESLRRRMQKYARKLEFAVKDRTEALNVERRLCEKLLVEMLPK